MTELRPPYHGETATRKSTIELLGAILAELEALTAAIASLQRIVAIEADATHRYRADLLLEIEADGADNYSIAMLGA